MDAGTAAGEGNLATRLPLLGLLAIQLFIGYEWLMSGITKILRGGFPEGLAEELTEKSEGAPGWYASLLDNAVIPNATFFGYVSEIGEVLVGVALVGGGSLWLLGDRLDIRARAANYAVIAFSALAGIFMNVNFHLANGSSHPWLLPGDGFDEGVDLDSLMPAIELAIAAVTIGLLVSVLRTIRAGRGES
jgi:thiosulfate dehydrogenase [quinone] large subunit